MASFTRRKFITVCSLGAAALSLSPIISACSKKGSSFAVNEFLKLSAVLTGFKESELDHGLAQIYLNSINSLPPSKAGLDELYNSLALNDGQSPGYSFVEAKVFGSNEEKILADTIITYWYTGTYNSPEGMKTASYQNQLAWRATGYLIPNAQCRGTFGLWQNKPTMS